MKRSGFKRKLPPRVRQEVKPSTLKASACRMWDGRATLTVPVRKFEYVRDKRLRAMCQAMPCQHCGASGADWAHSNWLEHGKAKGKKASDLYVAALCWPCHSWLDQGKGNAADKRAMWDAAHASTVAHAMAHGLWPEGVQKPSACLIIQQVNQ